jgi:DNA-binding HxlR family transcriptional regulator
LDIREVDYDEIYSTLDFYAHHGTLELLGALAQRPWRYSELINAVRGHVPHANTASGSLRRLVDEGLVSHDGVWYQLNPRGRRALPVIKDFVDKLGGIKPAGSAKKATRPQTRRTA